MRTRPVGVLAVFSCVASLGFPGAAIADTLDQQQPAGGSDARIQSNESLAQTFTAGLTGGLDRVELLLGAPDSVPTDPLTVEIRDVSGGSPGSTVLATSSVPPSAVGPTDAWVPITLAPAPPVTAGTRYAIVAYSNVDNPHSYVWALEFDNPYPAGANFFQVVSPPNGTWTLVLDPDQAFKTYVEVPAAAPPPPGTGPTGRRAKAKRKCKKKFHRDTKKRKKCLRKARKLPV
jgi:hypothetical protein